MGVVPDLSRVINLGIDIEYLLALTFCRVNSTTFWKWLREGCSKAIKSSVSPGSVKWEGLAVCRKGGQQGRGEGAWVAGVI